jgi:AmiR/NasT family two-component response regulator
MVDALRVLVCVDDGLTSLRLCGCLAGFGHRLLAPVYDGAEAVSAAAEFRPDLVVIDSDLLTADGTSATARIMEAAPTAVLILSTATDADASRAARADGASGYLLKPLTDDQLRAGLSAALASFAASRIGPPTASRYSSFETPVEELPTDCPCALSGR